MNIINNKSSGYQQYFSFSFFTISYNIIKNRLLHLGFCNSQEISCQMKLIVMMHFRNSSYDESDNSFHMWQVSKFKYFIYSSLQADNLNKKENFVTLISKFSLSPIEKLSHIRNKQLDCDNIYDIWHCLASIYRKILKKKKDE